MAIRLEPAVDPSEPAPIVRAALASRPRPFGPRGLLVPRELGDLAPRADDFSADQRAALVDALARGLTPHSPHEAIQRSLAALARPGTLVVATGQQPGFLGGPLYNLYKAAHAITLARALASRWGREVVALFWNHADDHDVAEVNHAWVVNTNLDLRRVGLAGLGSSRRALSRLALDEQGQRLGAVRELLRQTLPETEARDAWLDALAPRHGESLATAFTRFLAQAFGPHGLLIVEPDWMRAPIGRALARIVGAQPLAALAEGSRALAERSLPVTIEPEGAALAFRFDGDLRTAARARGAAIALDGEPAAIDERAWALAIEREPERWSPGALLRPIVQDLILPVAAYVGGPGELAYHAQLAPCRRACGAPDTPFVPRLSCTVVDGPTRESLERLDLPLNDAIQRGAATGADDPSSPRPDVAEALRARAEQSARELLSLGPDLAALDPGLAVQLKQVAAQIRQLADRLATKAERVHANNAGKGHRHARRVNAMLRPQGEPQERTLCALDALVRWGSGWLDELVATAEPLPAAHLALYLETDAARAPRAP